jgi:hypothetical protein
MKNLEKTCLHRFLGNCSGCEKDIKDDHHPNNYDCPRYSEVKIQTYYVLEDNPSKE